MSSKFIIKSRFWSRAKFCESIIHQLIEFWFHVVQHAFFWGFDHVLWLNFTDRNAFRREIFLRCDLVNLLLDDLVLGFVHLNILIVSKIGLFQELSLFLSLLFLHSLFVFKLLNHFLIIEFFLLLSFLKLLLGILWLFFLHLFLQFLNFDLFRFSLKIIWFEFWGVALMSFGGFWGVGWFRFLVVRFGRSALLRFVLSSHSCLQHNDHVLFE